MSAPKEIVAATIGSRITNDRVMIAANINYVSDWIDRERAQFMGLFDLGEKWEALAKAPTLFCIDQNGKPVEATK
jgi:hypothetical protein